MTKTATAEDRIREAATVNGWTVKKDVAGEVTFAKGRRYIDVVFSVKSTVIYAHTRTAAAHKDRAAFVLAEMEK